MINLEVLKIPKSTWMGKGLRGQKKIQVKNYAEHDRAGVFTNERKKVKKFFPIIS